MCESGFVLTRATNLDKDKVKYDGDDCDGYDNDDDDDDAAAADDDDAAAADDDTRRRRRPW